MILVYLTFSKYESRICSVLSFAAGIWKYKDLPLESTVLAQLLQARPTSFLDDRLEQMLLDQDSDIQYETM